MVKGKWPECRGSNDLGIEGRRRCRPLLYAGRIGTESLVSQKDCSRCRGRGLLNDEVAKLVMRDLEGMRLFHSRPEGLQAWMVFVGHTVVESTGC